MVFCTYCGQSFTRDEHLERHILTHTNVKPFKCFTCHMSFARRDLLQRHYTVHGKDQNNQEIVPAANGMIPKSAGRTPIACSNCAKTKTKCDKKFPCSRCAARNLRCTLRPNRRTTKTSSRVLVPPQGTPTGPPAVQPVAVKSASETHSTESSPLQQSPVRMMPSSPYATPGSRAEDTKVVPVADGPPSQLFDRPTSGPALSLPDSISPSMPNPSHFVHHTSLSGYDEFSHIARDDSIPLSSPRFMLDWSQMQVPLPYEGVVQPQHVLLNSDSNLDPNVLPLAPSGDGMLAIMPEIAKFGPQPLMTPMVTPKLEQGFSSIDLQSPPYLARQRQVSSSQGSSSQSDSCGEIPAIVAARDAWTCFRCTPTVSSISCPKTAKLNLERLEQTLKNHDGWSTWSPQWDESDLDRSDYLTVMQLHESTRDKLFAITQSFLHKALEIHKEGSDPLGLGHYSPVSNGASNFILLPPARVLEYFLRSYANCSELFYPLTSRGIVDVNELMHCHNDRAASLLVLMMIAQGAMNISSVDARMLTGGLTEACRISLFDLIERDIIMAGDPLVLHAALLFTVQAAWSGDKWQMDIAMGQRGMYFAMLRHSGILQDRSGPARASHSRVNNDQLWSEWIEKESRSRLIYSEVMVDQEMSLFHDAAPLFSVTEFATPMPDSDRLWQAKSAAEWSSIFEQVHEFSGGYSSLGSGARPLSLRDLFRQFLDDEIISLGIETTPLQLRLLLHPLQSLVCQYVQLLSCFSSESRATRLDGTQAISAASTRTRVEEVQSLLQRWFALAERYLKLNPLCVMMQTNLVIFHLISLNAVTDFGAIESLARRENFDGSPAQLAWHHRRCIFDVEEAVFHCGQVFRLVRSMPRGICPPWWAGAVYRIALVLWADSLARHASKDPVASENGMMQVPGPSLAIDALPADHPLIVRYLTKREGVPSVTKRDGSQIGIDDPCHLLLHCVSVIDEGASTRFSDGVRAKLERLARG